MAIYTSLTLPKVTSHHCEYNNLPDPLLWNKIHLRNVLTQMLTVTGRLFLARSGHSLIMTEEFGPRWANKLCGGSAALADITVHLVGRAIHPYTIKYRIRWFMLKTCMGDSLSRRQNILSAAPRHLHWGIPTEHHVCNVTLGVFLHVPARWTGLVFVYIALIHEKL